MQIIITIQSIIVDFVQVNLTSITIYNQQCILVHLPHSYL